MKNLITRTITGAIFIAAIIFSAIYSTIVFGIIFMFMALMGVHEFQRLTQKENKTAYRLPALVSAAIIYALITLYAHGHIAAGMLWMIMPVILLMVSVLLLARGLNSIEYIASDTLGIIFVVVPLALLNLFLNPMAVPGYDTPWLLLGMFGILWTHDTFAYLTGSMFGKNPLFKSISPKKSIEGSIGGLGFAIIAAYLVSAFSPLLGMWYWFAVAIIVSVFGTLGDLTESLLKRNAGVKDSGTLLPGHGGVLDRFDSILFVSPIVYILILLTNS